MVPSMEFMKWELSLSSYNATHMILIKYVV